MTLDDFLSALENLIVDQESNDDDPGEGNFGCEDCRACNQCRFCIGCDSCEDCTYCEECIESTSCTQSKRCVSCEKVSYCEDCRDCKASRYLTLCVKCTDSVHCLACVGISGGEFYVLNEKRTRKEYFSLLRQVQELMQDRMHAGWRPPSIGLASDIIDAVTAGRDTELSAAPWLDDLGFAPEPTLDFESERTYERARDYEPEDVPYRSERERPSGHAREPRLDSRDLRPERAPARRHEEDRRPEPSYDRRPEPSYDRRPEPGHARASEREDDEWMSSPPEFGSTYREPSVDDGRLPPIEYDRSESSWTRPRADFGHDLGRDLSLDESADWGQAEAPRSSSASDLGAERSRGRGPDYARGGRRDPPRRESDYARGSERARGSDYARGGDGYGRSEGSYARAEGSYARGLERDDRHERGRSELDYEDELDVPLKRDQHSTQPFARRESEPEGRRDESAPRERVWDDSRERTKSRDDRDRGAEAAPGSTREREPSSPWLDENAARPARLAKRNSLRRAGRPTRPPESESSSSVRDKTGTGSYRTGSAPERSSSRRGLPDYGESEGTNTGGTGLRLGRKPKRR